MGIKDWKTIELETLFLEFFEDCHDENSVDKVYDKLQDLLDFAYHTTIDELDG